MSIARIALAAGTTLVLLISSAPSAVAQASPSRSEGGKWELRFTSGAFVPTGDQRNVLEDAQVTGAQLAWVVRPSLAITGALAWARSRDIATTGAPKLDVFSSDLGVEARPARWVAGRAVTFSPFVGMGAGVRSYNYR